MRPPKTWIVADTHFNHDEIRKHCHRPDNCDELMVSAMRQLVAQQDLLVHLGDVIFYKLPQLKEIMNTIAGKKVLVVGNHDRKSLSWYRRNGFDFACHSFAIDSVLFTHRPYLKLPFGIKLNVHGHWHNLEEIPEWYDENSYYLVSMEKLNYKPIQLATILTERGHGKEGLALVNPHDGGGGNRRGESSHCLGGSDCQ